MELSAKKRETKGSKVKNLRKQGIIPAVVFSRKSSLGKADVMDIELNKIEFSKVYAEVGGTTIFEIVTPESRHDVLIKDVQVDPLKLEPIHVSFYEVDMSQPIEAEIPVELINEENCAPVVAKEGILLQVLDAVNIRCLPKQLPQNFEVDVSVLQKVEDFLTIKDAIKVDPEKIEILDDLEELIVKVDFAEQLEVEEKTPATVDQVEVISEEAKEGEEASDEAPKAE